MYRGTTPTFIFKIPFSCSLITLCDIAFSQNGTIVVDKKLADCVVDTTNNTISVTLTESETLQFTCACANDSADVQLRVGCNTARMASKIIVVPVSRILKDGILTNDVDTD